MLAVSFLPAQLARADEGTVYAATNNGVFSSSDGGASWIHANSGLEGSAVFCLAIDPSAPTTLYAGRLGGGVFKSTNGGQSWIAASSGLIDPIVLSIAIDPTNPKTIYAGTAGGGFFPGHQVFKSTDGGLSWTVSNSGLPVSIIDVLRIDPANAAVIYAGTNFAGVFKSVDAGRSWSAANSGMTPALIQDLAVDPDNTATIYAGLGGCSAGCLGSAGVFKSINGGMGWTDVNSGLTDLQVISLAVDPAHTGIVYAGTRSHGVFESINAGSTWNVVNPALLSTLFAILHLPLVVDPLNPGTIYAGTANGVFKSTDGGISWISANSGFPPSTSIFALAIAGAPCSPPRIGDVFASPSVLWPPNHNLVDVTVRYTATSQCPGTCTLSVSSNEPDGIAAAPDWVIVDANHVLLRAEREGQGMGRDYTITVTCTNSAGQFSRQSVTVTVPHDQR
jgi:photosystem II stability/assembly factor-like uncharacterized protein